jgi:hypothetical protein
MAFALAVAIGLGYVKFVRQRVTAPPAPAGQATAGEAGGAALADLEARVTAIEARTVAAAAALGGPQGHETS